MNNIDLSIYVPTYNHEKYIKKALDSIFEQKTNFNYEVLVGEDCSTDNTRKILKEYEVEHKDYVENGKLKIFYRESNMYYKIPDNATDLKKRSKGRYIIALEGDDYWLDDKKIEKQISFLDANPDFIAVSHNCKVVNEFGDAVIEAYPECKDNEYFFYHYMSDILPGQLTTLMYRNIYINPNFDCDFLMNGLSPGDRLIILFLLCHGRIYCIQECMSAYRHVTTHGDSYSANYKYSFKDAVNYYKEILLYLKTKVPSKANYGEDLYFRIIMKGIKDKDCTLKEAIALTGILEHRLFVMRNWIVYIIRKRILHKKIWI